jgi:hypothetical protein
MGILVVLNVIITATKKHSGMDRNTTVRKTRNSPATLAQPFVGLLSLASV